MLTDFVQTLTAETWRYLYPKKLVEGIFNSVKLVTNTFCGGEQLLNDEYNCNAFSSNSYIELPIGNITTRTPVASVDNVTITTVAGSSPDSTFKYLVKGLPKDIVAIGKSPDDNLLLKLIHFYPVGECYAFNVNPADYGFTSTKSGIPTITFYVVGGVPTTKQQPFFKKLFNSAIEKASVDTVNKVRTTGSSTNSVNGLCPLVGLGYNVSKEDTTIRNVWTEHNKKYALLADDVICASVNDTVAYRKGSQIEAGRLLSDVPTNKMLVYTKDNKFCWILNDTDSIPVSVITEVFPELAAMLTGSTITGKMAKDIFKNHGYYTLSVDGSIQLNKTDKSLLAANSIKTGSYNILQYIAEDLSKSVVLHNNVTPDVCYLLYSESSCSCDRINVGCSMPSILSYIKNYGGCYRFPIASLKGYTANGVVLGSRPTNSCYIYGIILAKETGIDNTVEIKAAKDLVYKYKELYPRIPILSFADLYVTITN